MDFFNGLCGLLQRIAWTSDSGILTQISSVVREIIIEKNRKKAIQKRKEERIADERNMYSDDIKYIENILEDCGFFDAGSTSKQNSDIKNKKILYTVIKTKIKKYEFSTITLI